MMIFQKQNVTKGYLRTVYNELSNSSYKFDERQMVSQRFKEIVERHGLNVSNEKYFEWNSSSTITNAIITVSNKNQLIENKNFEKLMNFLFISNCKHIVIHYLDFFPLEVIRIQLESLTKYKIHSVVVICEFHDYYFSDQFGSIIMNLNLNKKLIVLNSPFDKNFEDTMFFTQKTNQISFKKNINEFVSNHLLFTESQNFHTYFNQKIYIGPEGEIKNAPECEELFGYIQDIEKQEEFSKIIIQPEFQKFWVVNKERCDVCKDCEFRHMCVDNRIPFRRNEDEWYHLQACNYNPYISKWEGETNYLTLEECGISSSENGFFINHELVEKLNEKVFLQ